MTSTTGRDLGHGVRVMVGDGRRLVVQSSSFDLGWRARVGGVSGSVVMWEGSGFEVVDCEPWRRGARWTLQPWAGEEVMRVVMPLDEGTVGSAADAARSSARAAQMRPWLWLLSPFLGFAPAAWQRRWRDTWDFPATLATWLSAFLEVASRITPHKPILALKAGRTREGSVAVSSHTGTLVDQAAMATAMYRKAGVVEFHDTHQMVKTAIAMSTQDPPQLAVPEGQA